MQTHRFILVEDRTTGRQTVLELTASDAARLYSPFDVARLALGQPIPRGDTTHTDMVAFVNAHRSAPTEKRRRRGLAALLGKLAA